MNWDACFSERNLRINARFKKNTHSHKASLFFHYSTSEGRKKYNCSLLSIRRNPPQGWLPTGACALLYQHLYVRAEAPFLLSSTLIVLDIFKKAIRIPDKLFSTQPENGAVQFSKINSYRGVTIPWVHRNPQLSFWRIPEIRFIDFSIFSSIVIIRTAAERSDTEKYSRWRSNSSPECEETKQSRRLICKIAPQGLTQIASSA